MFNLDEIRDPVVLEADGNLTFPMSLFGYLGGYFKTLIVDDLIIVDYGWPVNIASLETKPLIFTFEKHFMEKYGYACGDSFLWDATKGCLNLRKI